MRLFRGIRRPMGGFMVDPGEQQAEAARAVEDRFSRHIDRKLNIEFGRLTRRMEFLMAKLQDVLEIVRAQKTKIESINVLMDGMRANIAQLLVNAGADQTTQQLVDQVFEAAMENSSAIDEAITENTVGATVGAVSDGPPAAEIKEEIKMPPPNPESVPELAKPEEPAPAAQG